MLYLSFVRSFFIVIWLKIKCKSRLQISFIQQLHHTLKLTVKSGARMSIERGMQCRRNCTLLCNSGKMNIGKCLFMNQNVMITCQEEIKIGNHVTIANNVVIVDHDHNVKNEMPDAFITDKVVIGDHVWIGANSVILRGCQIGENSIVAAGTVVRKGVYPPNSIIYNERTILVKDIFPK